MTERATCETCRWWQRDASTPEAGWCREPGILAPARGEFSPGADIVVLRFASMTCGEHQPRPADE